MLLIFVSVIEEWSSVVPDHLKEDAIHGLLSQSRIIVEVADELPAEGPHVIDVFCMVFGDRSEAARYSRNGRNRASICSPGGRSFSRPIQERGQPLRSRQ